MGFRTLLSPATLILKACTQRGPIAKVLGQELVIDARWHDGASCSLGCGLVLKGPLLVLLSEVKGSLGALRSGCLLPDCSAVFGHQ